MDRLDTRERPPKEGSSANHVLIKNCTHKIQGTMKASGLSRPCKDLDGRSWEHEGTEEDLCLMKFSHPLMHEVAVAVKG